MTLNTYIAGEPASGHDLAGFLSRRADIVHDKATSWHDARKTAETDWDGRASEAFIANRALPHGRDADSLSQVDRALAGPFTAWSDGITAAKDWMERAKEVAREGELIVLADAIYPPKAFEHLAPKQPTGQDNAVRAQVKAEFDAAKALHAKQQAAFYEAKALVQQARNLERQAHHELRNALTRQTDALKHLSQFQQWSEAAGSATAPAAVELMGSVTDLENKSVNATRAAFERAAGQSPFATNSMWSALTSEQRADLISRYPQMVGNTNGVPAVDRDIANRSILALQRQAIVNRIEQLEREYERKSKSEFPPMTDGTDQLKDSLAAIDKLEATLGNSAAESGYYLLGIDSTANDRGQAIIARGNPDTAHNTMTLTPGTASDLGDVGNYVAHNDKVYQAANAMSPEGINNVAITWAAYESPPELVPHASYGSYAEDGHAGLSNFQEGLRATHQGETPSHNTVVGHSYGTDLVGNASTNGGTHADELVFLGSPGVGVDHVSQLDVPSDHVWSGTSRDDVIHFAVDPTTVFTGTDDHWFGMNPSDPAFGGRVIPTDPTTGHDEYWERRESRDGLARVMTRQ